MTINQISLGARIVGAVSIGSGLPTLSFVSIDRGRR